MIYKAPQKYEPSWFSRVFSDIAKLFDVSVKKNERIYIGAGIDTHIVIISPNGTKYLLGVGNTGSLTTTIISDE